MKISVDACFSVDGSRLSVSGQCLDNYNIIKEIGYGKNGVVYHARNNLLNRDEAIKIWRSRDPSDSRDKFKQGILEAQKLALVSPDFAVIIYSAQEINGVLIATMEYVEGNTLEWYKNNSEPSICFQLAHIYINAIVRTTTAATRHGDAHTKNVLVYEEESEHETLLKMKLCDFGTSVYSGKGASEKRHWRIVKDTILQLTHNIPGRKSCAKVLDKSWSEGSEMARKAYAERANGIYFSDFDIARMWSAPLIDYLRDLRMLNLGK